MMPVGAEGAVRTSYNSSATRYISSFSERCLGIGFLCFLGFLLSGIKLMRGRNVTGEERERETKLPIS